MVTVSAPLALETVMVPDAGVVVVPPESVAPLAVKPVPETASPMVFASVGLYWASVIGRVSEMVRPTLINRYPRSEAIQGSTLAIATLVAPAAALLMR